jgi:hypothetical protein
MKIILDILFYFVKASSYQYAVRRMKRRGLVIYLKALQVSRKSLLGLFIFGFIFQMMVLGFVGASVTGILLLPEDLTTKLWIMFGLFSITFIVPFIVIIISLSEKFWFRAGDVKKLISEVES